MLCDRIFAIDLLCAFAAHWVSIDASKSGTEGPAAAVAEPRQARVAQQNGELTVQLAAAREDAAKKQAPGQLAAKRPWQCLREVANGRCAVELCQRKPAGPHFPARSSTLRILRQKFVFAHAKVRTGEAR